MLRGNIEASYHTLRHRLPLSTNFAAYQRLMLSTCHGLSQPSVLHFPLQAFTAHDGARYWLRIAISAYPTCIRRPHSDGGSRQNIAMPLGMEKLEWFGYPMLKTYGRYDYTF